MGLAHLLPIAAVAASVHAEPLLVDPARDTASWSAYLGWEFPGATGEVDAVEDAAQGPCVHGRFSFGGESRYAGVYWQGEIARAQAIGLRVKLPDRDGGMIRLRDATEQEHLGGFTAKRGEWVSVEVPVTPEQFGNHWGGANDGRFHFPLRAVLIAVGRGPDTGELSVSQLYVATDRAEPTERWQVTVRPGPPSGVALRGERAEYTVTALNRVRKRAEAELTVQVQQPGGRAREIARKHLVVGEWAQQEVVVPLPTGALGYSCLRAQLTDPEAGALPAVASGLVVVPRPRHYGKAAPDCYFGLQACPDMEAAERLGAKAVREAPGWRWAEPRRGQVLWDSYLDPIIKRDLDHHMAILLTLQGIAPDWAAWKTPDRPKLYDLPDPQQLDAWREFVRQVAARYRGRLAAIEIQNEPDLSCAYQPGLSLEEGADYYARLLRAGWEGVRAADPQLPVAGLDVSGGDFDGGLHYTDAVLSRASGQLDLYTGHPYASPRYFGPDQQPRWPVANQMAEKCRAALDLLARHGKPRRMWIGELGWGLAVTADPLSDHSLDFAACMAQSLIVGKSVPGVEKYLWFTQAGCNEGGYEYGLLRGQPLYPLPAAMAYATAAHILDAARPVGLKQVTGDLWRAVFVCEERNELIVAWWTDTDSVLVRPGRADLAGRWIGSFSQALRPTDRSAEVGRMPVYWVLPRGALRDHPRLLEEMQVTAPTPVTVEYVYVPAVDRVGLVLTNKTNAPQRPEIEVEGAKSTVELPAGAKAASREVSLPRALAIDIRRTLRVAVTAGGRRQSLTHAVSLEPLPAPPAAFRADGDLAEWSATRAFDLRDRKDVLPPDPGIGWDGPDDLSLRAYLAADGRGLYFAAAVTDDLHAAPNADPDNFWESDSLQLALDPTGDSHAGFDADDREVGFVLGADGPRAFLSYPAPRRRIEAPLAIVRTDSQTRHEVFLPWSALGVPTPRARQVLAIDFIANENDGRGRACWMGLTPGIGEAKTPSAYRRFVMP